MKASVEMVHPDNRVEFELWYSSILDVEKWRIYDLGAFARALK